MNSTGLINDQKGGSRFLINAAAFVIVVAGLRASSDLVIPVMVSAFLSVLCMPPIQWLQKKGVPTILALVIVITFIWAMTLIIVTIVGASITSFIQNDLVTLQDKMDNLLGTWFEKLDHKEEGTWYSSVMKSLEINLNEMERGSTDGTKRALNILRGMLSGFTSVLSNSFMIMLTMVFMVLEVAGLPAKLKMMPGVAEENTQRFEQIVRDIRQYMMLKTNMSLITGILIAVWLKFFGVKYFVVWGLLAFLMNYIPTIGSILAAIPAVLVALLGTDASPADAASAVESFDFKLAGITALGYLLVNVVIGNVIEPRVMGKGLGLSALVVFLSMVFWGWVLGPVGMVLSVPLTTILKIFLDSSEQTRWMAIMLGSDEA